MGRSSIRAAKVAGTRAVALALLWVIVGLFVCASASARLTFGASVPTSFGEGGTGDGQFEETYGVAVAEATKEVYVVDRGNKRVEIFNAAGEYLSQFDSSDNPRFHGEGFVSPTVIAVDNSTSATDPSKGDVYVFDSAHGGFGVEKFDASGKYLATMAAAGEGEVDGVTVAPSGKVFIDKPPLVLEDSDATVATPEIEEAFEIPFGEGELGQGIAVDSAEHTYILSAGGVVERFQGLGLHRSAVSCGCATGMAVDAASDSNELLIDEATKVLVYDSTGEPVGGPIGAGYLGASKGVAVNAATKDVYVTDAAHNDVEVFPPLSLATATSAAASSLTGTGAGVSATLNGTVDVEGAQINACRFEYGTNGAYGSTAECSPSPAPGGGSNTAQVSARITGLPPGTLYHYRLHLENDAGASDGASQAFVTPPATIDTTVVSNVTSFAATVSGQIEPGAELFTPEYHFAYGTSLTYGLQAPSLNASAATGHQDTVTQTIAGLEPATTYHVALIASNIGGGTFTGPDQTFTTRPLVPPAVSTGNAQTITQTTATLTGTLNP
jgi:hypothetical protein